MTLWEIDIHPAPGQPDLEAQRVSTEASDLGLVDELAVRSASGYLIEADLTPPQVQRVARDLLADGVVQTTVVAPVGDDRLRTHPPYGHLSES